MFTNTQVIRFIYIIKVIIKEFYNDTYPFVIEYVLNNNPHITKVFDS